MVKEQDQRLETEDAFYRKKMLLAMFVPGMLVVLMWVVLFTGLLFETPLTGFGIYPLSYKGLPGIFFSPFIHADTEHLFNNSLPLFFLGTALFYFYSDLAFRILGWTWLLTGLLVWLAGREAWHIGASGLVYGLASFLFFSGMLRRHFRLIALSLLIVFLYGSMVWGLFPGIYRNVSWESHMLGFISGIVLAIRFRNEGLQEPVYDWLDDDEEDESKDDSQGSDQDNVQDQEQKTFK
jgi:membrane associated rhomboid family serine protease